MAGWAPALAVAILASFFALIQWLPVYKEFLAARDELMAAARRLLMSIMDVDEHQ